jgi:hypothetical protein
LIVYQLERILTLSDEPMQNAKRTPFEISAENIRAPQETKDASECQSQRTP